MKQSKIKEIFIVDDDPFWTGILNQLLTELGYSHIHSFTSGASCLEHLHLNPSLVFLDYQMEEMDGLEVLQKIKSHSAATGVVFCTAQEDLNIAVTAMQNGSFDYLLKANANKKEVGAIISSISQTLGV
jgi:DNA-binding NtrC family response regulator